MKTVVQSNLVFRLALASLFFFALVPFVARSSYFLQPISITLADDKMVFVRTVRFMAVRADWAVEVYATATGLECDVSGNALFQPRPFETVRVDIPPEIAPCLNQPGVKVLTGEWTVLLFGLAPMQPVTLTTTIGGE